MAIDKMCDCILQFYHQIRYQMKLIFRVMERETQHNYAPATIASALISLHTESQTHGYNWVLGSGQGKDYDYG